MKYKVSKLKTTKARMNFVYSIRHLRRLMTREIDDDDYNGKRKYIYTKRSTHTFKIKHTTTTNYVDTRTERMNMYLYIRTGKLNSFNIEMLLLILYAHVISLCLLYYFFCMHFEWVERSPTTHTLSLTCFHLRLTHKFLVPNNVYTCVVDEYVAAML